MDNNFIKNLKDIIRRYENDDEQQHAAAKQWKLAAEMLMDDCRALLNTTLSMDDAVEKMVNAINDRDKKISVLKSRITELERMTDPLFNETARANELAKRIDEAIFYVDECAGIHKNYATNLIKILNGRDGE